MKSVAYIIAPPLLCTGILLAMQAESATRLKPKDAESYHQRAKAEIAKLEFTIGDAESGIWVGKDIEPTRAAIQLLQPNIILSRQYTDTRAATQRHWERTCGVLIVQCKDSGDMVGHYPKNCYRSTGDVLVDERERDWIVKDVTIPGTEYTFERYNRGQPIRRSIYSFLVVPGNGIQRDIKGVNKAAEDYQRRYFGAAQFQFVMSADLPRDERDKIFATLMGNNVGVLAALNDAGPMAAGANP